MAEIDWTLSEEELTRAKTDSLAHPYLKKLLYWYDQTLDDEFLQLYYSIKKRLSFLTKSVNEGALANEANEKEINALIKLMDKMPNIIDGTERLEERIKGRSKKIVEEAPPNETPAERNKRLFKQS